MFAASIDLHASPVVDLEVVGTDVISTDLAVSSSVDFRVDRSHSATCILDICIHSNTTLQVLRSIRLGVIEVEY